MQPDRRDFLKLAAWLSASGATAAAASLASAATRSTPADPLAVLVDLGACIGCRHCEYACRLANGFEAGSIEAYDDQSVFLASRRPDPQSFTVVNAYESAAAEQPLYAKINCMHCNEPACVSACIVGALQKQADGPVTYDAWKCIGCRYCMVACPFQIPAYEYDNAFTPEVRKCEFCRERTAEGKLPACVEICPQNAMTFGLRSEMLALARQKIDRQPGRYVDHIYGEHEMGGTSWLYISPVPFEQAGFLKLGTAAPGALTEAIQHGVFKWGLAPVGLYGFLAAMMWWTGRRAKQKREQVYEHKADPPARMELVGAAAGTGSIAGAGNGLSAGAIAATWAPGATREIGLNFQDLMDRLLAPAPVSPAEQAPAEIEAPETEPAEPDDYQAHHDHHQAEPVRQRLLTPGVWILIAMVLTGAGFALYRFIFGLGASTNLNQQYPWGLWIAMDVGSGIALAGGGFLTAALVHIFHREHYHAIARSALLVALLGYTFYVPGLLADLGRWYNLWHPILPSMWQVNSVLFEVGICVMLYLNVQYAELMPILCQPVMGRRQRFGRLARLAKFIHDKLERIMPALLILGVSLSFFHQSSLGNLMVIAPYKLHELWWTPVMPIQFLLSAMMVGFPMVIFTILTASWALRRAPEMHVLAPLSRYIPVFLSLYLGLKIGDMIVRGSWMHLFEPTLQSFSWIVEMLLVIVPLALLLRAEVRNSERWLAAACLMVILGVVLNRLNVFVIAYHPPFVEKAYFPSLTEFMVSMGLVAALMLTYRVAINYLPILHPRPRRER